MHPAGHAGNEVSHLDMHWALGGIGTLTVSMSPRMRRWLRKQCRARRPASWTAWALELTHCCTQRHGSPECQEGLSICLG